MINKVIAYTINNWQYILYQSWIQLSLLIILPVVVSTIIGIPLGILCSYKKNTSWVIKIVSILQTIPSLVMFTIMIVIGLGIGNKPAVVALIIYSILPIVVNTYQAFNEVDPQSRFIAKTMGMNNWQLLIYNDFPVSFPMILTGMKLSAMTCASSAVLANIVGGGGLGTFILAGINQLQYMLIIVGGIPSIIITWLVDAFFNRCIKIASTKVNK